MTWWASGPFFLANASLRCWDDAIHASSKKLKAGPPQHLSREGFHGACQQRNLQSAWPNQSTYTSRDRMLSVLMSYPPTQVSSRHPELRADSGTAGTHHPHMASAVVSSCIDCRNVYRLLQHAVVSSSMSSRNQSSVEPFL